MWRGYEWSAFLGFWSETLDRLVGGIAAEGENSSVLLLPKVIGPVIPGTGIVMTVSFLERVILDALVERDSHITWVKLDRDDWVQELGVDQEWVGWPLIQGMTRLRHCFAHEYGRATNRQFGPLIELSDQLKDNPIRIPFYENDFNIGQFYVVNPDTKEIILSNSACTRIHDGASLPWSVANRIIFMSFLDELEKVNIVDMSEWKTGSR